MMPAEPKHPREKIADELERQVIEDYRNPTLGAPEIDGRIPRALMMERADRILSLLTVHVNDATAKGVADAG